MVLADHQIRALALDPETRMIEPFAENAIRPGVISYGETSYGYDFRIGRKFKVFTNSFGNVVVDPKKFDERAFVDIEGDTCVIPPNSFVLANTIEEFFIPRGLVAICIGKSTYARCGLILNITPAEPEWCGHLTVEISNTTPLPAIVYANEGIGQMLFLRGDTECKVSYADKKGRYQGQTEITLPTVDHAR